jgi:hypothetical protein
MAFSVETHNDVRVQRNLHDMLEVCFMKHILINLKLQHWQKEGVTYPPPLICGGMLSFLKFFGNQTYHNMRKDNTTSQSVQDMSRQTAHYRSMHANHFLERPIMVATSVCV